MKNPYDGDILECALNSGIPFASQKYDVDKRYVFELVRKFKDDIDDGPKAHECVCSRAARRGVAMMCFMCSGSKKGWERITLGYSVL